MQAKIVQLDSKLHEVIQAIISIPNLQPTEVIRGDLRASVYKDSGGWKVKMFKDTKEVLFWAGPLEMRMDALEILRGLHTRAKDIVNHVNARLDMLLKEEWVA